MVYVKDKPQHPHHVKVGPLGHSSWHESDVDSTVGSNASNVHEWRVMLIIVFSTVIVIAVLIVR